MGAPKPEPFDTSDEDLSWSPNTDAAHEISVTLNALLADLITLYLKTKNFHWHVRGPQFRDYHLLLGEQADQIIDAFDSIAERVRKVGGSTIRSLNTCFVWRAFAAMTLKRSRLWTCSASCVETTGSSPNSFATLI